MSAVLFALAFGATFGGWVFSRLQRETGSSSSRQAWTGAAVATIIAMIVLYTIARMVLPKH